MMAEKERGIPLLDEDELSVSSELSSASGESASTTFEQTESDERRADFDARVVDEEMIMADT